jgi:CRISPR/Cas system-associated endonuclease Cas3-HD
MKILLKKFFKFFLPTDKSSKPTIHEAEHRKLMHDIRNALVPAFLVIDTLKDYDDQKILKVANQIGQSLEKVMSIIQDSRDSFYDK